MNRHKAHLVIGDVILDRFIYGEVSRISPEAPALVLDVDHQLDLYGGANNVAAHLCSLEHRCKLISVVGSDFQGISATFDSSFPSNCQTHFCVEENRFTPFKTRLVSIYKRSHLLRFDRESTHDVQTKTEDDILERVRSSIGGVDVVILIDYRKGTITERVARSIIKLARRHEKPVFVDTKCDDLRKFRGCSLLKPNKFEFQKILLRHSPNLPMPEATYHLLKKLEIGCIVKTAGAEGIFAYTQHGRKYHVAGEDVEVRELSGAGDSVLAVLSFCYAEGYTLPEALASANRIAAQYVSSGASYKAKVCDLQDEIRLRKRGGSRKFWAEFY